MKTILSKILLGTMVSSALILWPVAPAMAVTNTNNNSDVKSETCTRVTLLRTNGQNAIAINMKKMNDNFSALMKKITSDEANTNKKLTAARVNAKKKFEEKIAILELKDGLTEVQKQAIEIYKTNMELAKTSREFAVDGALTEYRKSLSSAVTDQQKYLSNAVTIYQNSVKKAFDNAVLNCDKENLSALKTAVQSARQDLKAMLSNNKTSDTIKLLAKTRNNSIKAANDAFSKQAATFTKTLKTALGE